MPLDFVFEKFEESGDGERTDIDFICSFEGAIPSKKEVLDDLALYFDFGQGSAEMDRFRPVKGRKQIKGRITITR